MSNADDLIMMPLLLKWLSKIQFLDMNYFEIFSPQKVQVCESVVLWMF